MEEKAQDRQEDCGLCSTVISVEKYAQITLYRANQNHTARRKAHYDKLTAYAYTKRRFPTVLGDIVPPIDVGKVG